MSELTAQRLRELLSYDPETGLFQRVVKRTSGGSGWTDKQGYVQLMVDRKTYSAHRLAWLYVMGTWPNGDIDHINGIKTDNRIANLRDVSEQINMQNEKRPRKNNASGFMGVHWRKERQRWVAQLRVNGRSVRLGAFKTPEEAHAAYLEGKRMHHPGFTL